jgi:hypothetical protein
MFTTNRNSLLFFLVAIAIAVFGLSACGGGGTAATPTATPTATPAASKPPGITYTAFGKDLVSSVSLTFDVDGGISDGTTTYTLASTANGGCSFTSNPNEPDLPVCNPVAGGQAFLLCPSLTGEYFETVLFKSSVVAADVSEIKGMTLSSVSCGSPSIRTASWTIDFNANDTIVEKHISGSSNSYGAGLTAQLFSSLGMRYFDFQHRFVLRKHVAATKTTYFLMDLYENVAGTQDSYNPKIYVIEK